MAKKKGKTIGSVANGFILKGLSDEETLAAVLEEFPQAKTTLASIKVYRSNLRREVREGKREPGLEGPPERQRGGLRKERGPMPAQLKEQLRDHAKEKAAALHEERMRQQEQRLKKLGNPSAHRQRLLKRYVARVLSFGTFSLVKSGKRKGELTRPKDAGAKRLAFFEANPISEIFR